MREWGTSPLPTPPRAEIVTVNLASMRSIQTYTPPPPSTPTPPSRPFLLFPFPKSTARPFARRTDQPARLAADRAREEFEQSVKGGFERIFPPSNTAPNKGASYVKVVRIAEAVFTKISGYRASTSPSPSTRCEKRRRSPNPNPEPQPQTVAVTATVSLA